MLLAPRGRRPHGQLLLGLLAACWLVLGSDPASAQIAEAQRERDEVGEKLRWRGTGVSVSHETTTTAWGIGGQRQSRAHEAQVQGYTLALVWFVVDESRRRLRLAAAPGVDLELTNSDETTREREPRFRDLPLSVTTAFLLRGDPRRNGTLLGVGGGVFLPTSKASHADGTRLSVSPRLTLIQTLPLEPHALERVQLFLQTRWDHRFSRATEPVSRDLARPRQTREGDAFLSDQLSGVAFATDELRLAAGASVEQAVGRGSIGMEWSGVYAVALLPRFAGDACEVELATGCVRADRVPHASRERVRAGFGASLFAFPAPEWGIAVGYSNVSAQPGPDGGRRSPFYSPYATFSLRAALALDALWLRARGTRRESPYFAPELL
jgi:hypothetical protein